MKTRTLLFILFAALLFSFATVISILFNTPPSSNNIIIMFYFALYVFVFGTIFFFIYCWHYFHHHAVPPWSKTIIAIRLSAIIALWGVAVLIMKSYNQLNWPTFIVLTVMAIILGVVLNRYIVKIKSYRKEIDIPI